jgi:murein L,D-transpeptidase YafK
LKTIADLKKDIADMKTNFVLTSIFIASGILVSGIPSPSKKAVSSNLPAKNASPIGTAYIIIDKSDYELHVYDDKGSYATYPVLFGNSSQAHQKMQGDKNTPELTF